MNIAKQYIAPRFLEDMDLMDIILAERTGTMARVLLLVLARVREDAHWACAKSPSGVRLEPGQAFVSHRELSARLGINKKAVARVLRDLKKLGIVHADATPKGTVLTLLVEQNQLAGHAV